MGAKGFYTAQDGHIVNVLAPVDITGGKTGAVFNMKNYAHASIVIQVGVSAAAFTKIIVNECTANDGTGATAIPFDIYTCETSNTDVTSGRTAVTAAGYTPSANDGIFYIIELDAAQLARQQLHPVVADQRNKLRHRLGSSHSLGRSLRRRPERNRTQLVNPCNRARFAAPSFFNLSSMDIRLKTGRYAGEIRDIPAPEAKLMIADGRAEDPRLESLATDQEDPKPKSKQKKR